MFIAETWADEAGLDIVQRNIDFKHKWVVMKEGCGGGIALFWKALVNLEVVDSSNYYIDTCVDKGTDNEWHFISFYGEPTTSRRSEVWDNLQGRLNHISK